MRQDPFRLGIKVTEAHRKTPAPDTSAVYVATVQQWSRYHMVRGRNNRRRLCPTFAMGRRRRAHVQFRAGAILSSTPDRVARSFLFLAAFGSKVGLTSIELQMNRLRFQSGFRPAVRNRRRPPVRRTSVLSRSLICTGLCNCTATSRDPPANALNYTESQASWGTSSPSSFRSASLSPLAIAPSLPALSPTVPLLRRLATRTLPACLSSVSTTGISTCTTS